jgi:peptidyl-tRNA hydrolase, PTH1 family
VASGRMDLLYLIAGLGNPGSEYALTRHNAGFLAVERFGAKYLAEWKRESRFRARVARMAAGPNKVVLCEPETFMNLSGEAIAPLAGFFKVPTNRILVLVDDADLPLGQIRMRAEGSSGGHHGLESIEKNLGTRSFARQRIGIGRTERQGREIAGHVLGKFTADERELLERVLEQAVAQIDCYLAAGIEKAMSQFNGAVAPAKKEEK